MDLTGMAVSVIAYQEPKHLYVTLDALTMVHGIDQFPITVYVDGGLSDETRAEQESALACFPAVCSEFSEVNIGIRENVMRGLRRPIENGATSILFIEDDHLVRPDILSIPLNDETGCFFIALNQCFWQIKKKYRISRYNAKGNVITAENARKLLEWLDAKAYIGRIYRNNANPIGETYMGHDVLPNIYLRDHGEFSVFPVGMYVSHFGLFGVNFARQSASTELLELEQRMFAGDKTQWLDNIAKILEAGDYPTEPSVIEERLYPRGFKYYGDVDNTPSTEHWIAGIPGGPETVI